MAERTAKVTSNDERDRLVEVDAFLTDYLKKERRNASRKKVREACGTYCTVLSVMAPFFLQYAHERCVWILRCGTFPYQQQQGTTKG